MTMNEEVQGEWVMVPREPTKAMLEASIGERFPYLTDAHLQVLKDGFAAKYRAMLAAAPASPSSSQQERGLEVSDEAVEAAAKAIAKAYAKGKAITVHDIAQAALLAASSVSPATGAQPVDWVNGEREIMLGWLSRFSKNQRVDDMMRLDRLCALLSTPQPSSTDSEVKL